MLKFFHALSDKTRYRLFQWFFVAVALNFLIPTVSYIVAPELARQTMNDVNLLLGGPAWPANESSQLWHMLAVGNVATLGALCLFIAFDVIRLYAMLPALLFLKFFSAFYSLALGFTVDGVPAFFAVFVLDGTTAFLLGVFGVIGHRAALRLPLSDQPVPVWSYVLLRPRRVQQSLANIAAAQNLAAPSLWQMVQWTARMWHRVVFCLDTVGSGGTAPVRSTWRARLLARKPIRFFALVYERAISPFDMSGLATSPERVMRHLCGAHHDGQEFAYDLEMLSFHDGALSKLRETVQAIVDDTHPSAAWLADLCVYEGYHQRLLAGVDAAIAGELEPSTDADTSFIAMLAWARAQPVSPNLATARPNVADVSRAPESSPARSFGPISVAPAP